MIHYNWHWFWNWGTGEALNNGTHEMDVIRWGLGADFPLRVGSMGGCYHFKDDWQTPDTQIITYDFPSNMSAMWESRSCNSKPVEGSDRGVIFYGENGSLETGGNEYTFYDLDGKVTKKVTSGQKLDGQNALSPSLDLDVLHINNFLDCIRTNNKPNADIENGFKSTLLVQLGNIAWRKKRSLNIDPANGHIVEDKDAALLWSREYEKGWEPKI